MMLEAGGDQLGSRLIESLSTPGRVEPTTIRRPGTFPNASGNSLSWLSEAPFASRQIAGCSEIRISDFNVYAVVQYRTQRLTTSQILCIASHSYRKPSDLIDSLDNKNQDVDWILHSEHMQGASLMVVWRDESISLVALIRSGHWFAFFEVCFIVLWKYVRLILRGISGERTGGAYFQL
jgi:hypothetical protein